MNGVFEHVVDKVGIGLHEIIQVLQVLQFLAFLLIKDVKVDIRGVQLHILELLD